jgi:hypothetical protein
MIIRSATLAVLVRRRLHNLLLAIESSEMKKLFVVLVLLALFNKCLASFI